MVAGLREHYGLDPISVKVVEPYQMLGGVDEDLRQALGVDTIDIMAPNTLFGFPVGDWKPWTTPWGQAVQVPGQFVTFQDKKGFYVYPEGDDSVPPSAHMPTASYFFDTIIRQDPIVEDQLDPRDNLEEFGLLSEGDIRYFQKKTAQVSQTDYGVVATCPGLAFGDIALVPAPFMKHPKGIRDIAEWYMSLALRPDYIRAVFDPQLEYGLTNLQTLKDTVGDAIDVLFICGTDFGTQVGTFCSVETFRELWKPYYQAVNKWIHTNTSWKTFKHSCGAVYDFIEDFIDSGFDILNPVQCSATGMDPRKIKEVYGDRITLWGGGVDTQHTLPFGTPEEVRVQVLERCEIFSRNGGFVFNPIHNIQARVPIENAAALFEAVKEFRGR
jgi:hypothetical protein